MCEDLTDHELSVHSAVDKTTVPCRNLVPNNVSELLIAFNRSISAIGLLHLIKVFLQLI